MRQGPIGTAAGWGWEELPGTRQEDKDISKGHRGKERGGCVKTLGLHDLR